MLRRLTAADYLDRQLAELNVKYVADCLQQPCNALAVSGGLVREV
jgi:hypothetical protein